MGLKALIKKAWQSAFKKKQSQGGVYKNPIKQMDNLCKVRVIVTYVRYIVLLVRGFVFDIGETFCAVGELVCDEGEGFWDFR